jgi:prepilin-type N-terminal cleavage/methylation domain-containing protein
MSRANGFTVIEVLVALVIFALGVLGLAAETAALTHLVARTRRAAAVAEATSARLERLRGAACARRRDGTEPVRQGSAALAELQWTWTDAGDSVYRVRLVAHPDPAARALAAPETAQAVFPCRS